LFLKDKDYKLYQKTHCCVTDVAGIPKIKQATSPTLGNLDLCTAHHLNRLLFSVGGIGVVASIVRRMNEVTLRQALLVLGWVTSLGGYTVTVCNQPTRPTQPCIPPGSLNRVPALAGVKAGMSPLAGGRCDPIWHMNSSSRVATSVNELLYLCYFTLLNLLWLVNISHQLFCQAFVV